MSMPPILHEEISARFTYHPPKEGQRAKYTALRTKAKELAELIVELCPNSRECSTALTNLEQSVMWANAAIARRS
jgi:hypothetical protein